MAPPERLAKRDRVVLPAILRRREQTRGPGLLATDATGIRVLDPENRRSGGTNGIDVAR
jgi:hypothetical protein